jgi:serine/threonine-protein kinase
MSPEQAQGHRATKKSDLYSLGAVMYVMLTGRPPFSGKTTLEVIQKHRYGNFDRPCLYVPEMPHWLEEIVVQLLEKDPDKRYADAFVLSRRLQEVEKKVRLSSQDLTEASEYYDGSARTIALDTGDPGPGQGTLMRDLVRAELERSQKRSPAAEVFNNTWVLLASLVLLIAGGVFWFRSGTLSAEERFQNVVTILEDDADPDWRTARAELQRLLDEDPERWSDEVAPLMAKTRIHEFRSKLSRRRPGSRRPSSSENVERFVAQAQHYLDVGEFSRAKRKLTALAELLEGEADYEDLHRLTQQMLGELEPPTEGESAGDPFLAAMMQRAQQSADAGLEEEARKTWANIIELYHDDPRAKTEVENARSRIEQMTAKLK